MFSVTVAPRILAISFALLSFFLNAAPVCGQSGVPAREPFIIGQGPFDGGGGWFTRRGDDPDYESRAWVQLPWPNYVASGGAVHPAMGDVDADGRDEIILGVDTGGNGWIAVLDDVGAGHALLSWIQIPWPAYNAANGAVYPAVADVDGDGRAEIIAGLGTGAAGWFAVFDDASTGFALISWRQVDWPVYVNGNDGSTRVAAGDLNGDGRAEVVVGLGPGSNGWIEVFGSAQTGFAHQSWIQVPWPVYDAANGSVFPAVGDMDNDGRGEIVAGLGRNSNGWLAIFQDAAASYAFDRWVQLPWVEYNAAVGESHPAVGNVDADPASEIIVGLAQYANNGGWFAIIDDLGSSAAPTWRNLDWDAFKSGGGATYPAIGTTNDGLVAAYSFDGSGLDSSGSGRHASTASVFGSPDRFGRSNAAFRFNGANSAVTLSGLPPLTGDFTVSFWMKSASSGRMHALSFGSQADNHLDIEFNDGNAVLAYWNIPGSGISILSSGQAGELTDDLWHHVVLRRYRGDVMLMVDGVARASISGVGGTIASSGVLRIGRGSYGTWWWNGWLDDVLVYRRALSASEVASLSADRPLLEIRTPTSSDHWPAGSARDIHWSAHASISTVTLQYSIDNGLTWYNIAQSVSAASGTYNWTVPSHGNRIAHLRMIDASNGEIVSPIESFVIVNGGTNVWQQVTASAAWGPRDGTGPLVFNGRMWLLGGWHPGDPTTYNQIWSSEDGLNWTLNGTGPWSGTHTCGCVVFNNRMWIINGNAWPDVWSSPDGVNWTLELDGAPWNGRYKPYVVVHDNRIWLMGGFDPFTYEPYNDVWSSSDGVTWTRVTANAPWAGRGAIHGGAVFAGKIWIAGGGHYPLASETVETHYNDVWNSSDGATWTRVTANAPWPARLHHSVMAYADRLWVMAGHVNTPEDAHSPVRLLNDVWTSQDGVTWTELGGTPWSPRHAASTLVHNGSLWLMAGFLVNDVWKLQLEGNLSIEEGAATTSTRTVALSLAPPGQVDAMQFSNDGSTWSSPEAYAQNRTWTLTAGAGIKTVYVRFRNGGAWGEAYKDEIVYNGS